MWLCTMIIKPRSKPRDLKVLEILDRRMNLPTKSKEYLDELQKDLIGKQAFDELLKKLTCDHLILNDLRLSTNNTTSQIDSLLITASKIYIFKIKYVDGDNIYQSERILKLPSTEIVNPIFELRETEVLLQQLLQQQNFDFKVESFVVFNHPEFTLYEAPMDQPFIFFGQLDSFINSLNRIDSSLSIMQENLVNKLESIHISSKKQASVTM